jgi:outer membrane protein
MTTTLFRMLPAALAGLAAAIACPLLARADAAASETAGAGGAAAGAATEADAVPGAIAVADTPAGGTPGRITVTNATDPYADLNNSLRLGLYEVFYHTSANDLNGPFVPAGANLKAENNTTLYAAYVRTLSDHFAVELAFGVPPLVKTEGKGIAELGSVPYNGQVIATARWFAPTVLLEYQFFDKSAALRPFIGVGVNYTSFYDRNSTAAGNAVGGGPTKLELPASIGPAGTVGLSYKIAPQWGLYASYSITRVDTRLTAETAGVIRTTHIAFGPQALVLSAGYSF